jgi:N6-L-threonylcarbamoyladenine synthase
VASTVSSQIPLHKKYSGVVPEIASRAHVDWVNSVIASVTKKTKPDVIAVTVGPGLVGSLLVGKMTAEALGWAWDLPVVGINHIEGHLLSAVLEHPALKPPFLGLVVSGGHTELLVEKKWGHTELLGRTRDDAAGEAFDKVAKMMALGYPGGPVIDRLAKSGNPSAITMPRPWLPQTWDFSFSGLKTAVLYTLREKKKWSLQDKKNLCASFQEAVVDVLVGKTFAAAEKLNMQTIVVGGGVAANSRLRQRFLTEAAMRGKTVYIASPAFCTDNAAMIASAAYFKLHQKPRPALDLTIRPGYTFPAYKSKNAL